jgi:DNA-binding NtrC family response regulator
MARPTVMVVAGDSILFTAVTDWIQVHVPHVRVHHVPSPRLALAQLERQEVATVVTALHMDELDGFALLRGAKALRPNVPVILCSSHVHPALASQAVNMGAQEVLRTPINRTELLTALTLALNTSDLAREVRIRHLMVNRLSKRREAVTQAIAARDRPTTLNLMPGRVSSTRTGTSVASLNTLLDRLSHHTRLAEARLDVAEQRLIGMQHALRHEFLKRIAC